jgi:hypothetical protein
LKNNHSCHREVEKGRRWEGRKEKPGRKKLGDVVFWFFLWYIKAGGKND